MSHPDQQFDEMSDDDFMNLDLEAIAEPAGESLPSNDEPESEPEAAPAASDQEDTPDEDLPDVPEESQQDDPEEPAAEGAEPDEPAAEDSDDQPNNADDDSEAEEQPAAEESDAGEINKEEYDKYKSFFDVITAPFNANGKSFQVESAEEALQLMQMGANYNKKMMAIKPNTKILKMLENNGLLDESKLNYLIDLDKKNPDAIAKLVQESGIDPLDVDPEKANDYQPNSYSVGDKEVALQTVLDDIRDTPTFSKTMDVITKEWDGVSQDILVNNPRIIALINEHMASGLYPQISARIERERMFGRLNGLSDIAAYKQIGDQMNSEGAFDTPTQEPAPVKPPVKPKPAPANKDKKLAAAAAGRPGKKAAPSAESFDPSKMPDSEFEKLFEKYT